MLLFVCLFVCLCASALFRTSVKGTRNSGSTKDKQKQFPTVKRLSEADRKRILVGVASNGRG